MAEHKKHRPSSASSASSGGKVTRTCASSRPKPLPDESDRLPVVPPKPSQNHPSGGNPKKSKKTGKRSGSSTGNAGKNAGRNAGKNAVFSQQYLPYIWAAVGIFLVSCLICDTIRRVDVPSDHLMGPVGYYVCRFLFGIFGWSAYMIPLLLIHLAVFWRRYCREKLVVIKVSLSVVALLLISAMIHVGLCARDTGLSTEWHPVSLYRTGAHFESGGVIGGLIGFVLYQGLRLPGSIILFVVTMPLVLMGLIGVTPMFAFGKIRAVIEAKRAEKAADRAEQAAHRQAQPEPFPDDGPEEEDGDFYGGAMTDLSGVKPAKPAKPGKAGKAGKTDDACPPLPDGAEGDPIPVCPIDPFPEMPDGDTVSPVRSGKSRSRTKEAAAEQLSGLVSEEWPDEDDPYPAREETEHMEISLDGDTFPDESVTETANSRSDGEAKRDDAPTPTVAYDVVDDAAGVCTHHGTPDSAGATGTAGEETTGTRVIVHVNRADPTAVEEKGLPESETVVPHTQNRTLSPENPEKEYCFPPLDLLTEGEPYVADEAEIAENTLVLRKVLESFNIGVREISCSCGPTITRFEVKPQAGVRVRSIANLVDDIALGLAKSGVRIEAPIPNKSAVGIEVPNAKAATVYLRTLLETPEFRNHKSCIVAGLGADVSGRPVIFDVNKMPHLLIAGATGMGKSVCINSILISILYKATPKEVKFILIDPKKVEFTVYRHVPHLFIPIVSDPKKAAGALYSAVNEMKRRYTLMEEVGSRNVDGYNKLTEGDPERPPLNQLIIVIDELADLMMTAANDVEAAICRLAQMGRAAGIHLIIGTQRPSVDVITGLIKANIPSRIAFTVASQVDSRTIIDTAGADKLIGRGDMLFAPVGPGKPSRVQGAFVSDGEVESVVSFIKEHNGTAVYDEAFTKDMEIEAARCAAGKHKPGEQLDIGDFDDLHEDDEGTDGEDPKFWESVEVCIAEGKVSTSLLQRRVGVGYGRAAKMIDRMFELGFAGQAEGNKPRKILITENELKEYRLNRGGKSSDSTDLPGEATADPEDDGEDDLSESDFDALDDEPGDPF